MDYLFIDLETYSSRDLKTVGLYKYVEDPEFEVLICGYAFNREPVAVVDLVNGEEWPERLVNALNDPNVIKVAHNSAFERRCFARIGMKTSIEQWRDTLILSAYAGLPLALKDVCDVLKIKERKLATGLLLIRFFSCPCKPTKADPNKTRNYPEDDLEKWESYKEYNDYDVRSEREIFYKLTEEMHVEWPESELALYILDQQINDKGILLDLDLAEKALDINEKYSTQVLKEAQDLTGLDNPNSVAQLADWIEATTGLRPESFEKRYMPQLYVDYAKFPEVIQMLDLRKKLAKSSIKKYQMMLNCAMDDRRIRGTFQFYGANRTGRWAGRLLQLQNLAKNHISHIEIAREAAKTGDVNVVGMMYDDVSDILSQLIRTAIIAPEGMLIGVADFSAIEARVISWYANEQWRMDVFNGDGKIYEATGSKMFGVPISAITKGSELRQKSKISELALGYGGGVNALERMGGHDMGLSQQVELDLVRKWRNANPAIVKMWSELETAAVTAIKYHKPVVATVRKLVFECDGENLTIKLPSGRKLYYRHPHFKNVRVGSSTYQSSNIFYEGTTDKGVWGDIDTYGGKLTENIVQATARDMLGNSMLNLAAAGYLPICHIHDEVLIEIPKENAEDHYNKIVSIMDKQPKWALDMPLKADGYVTPFYLKD